MYVPWGHIWRRNQPTCKEWDSNKSFLLQDARSKNIEDVLILSGDHLYRMDYMDFVQVRLKMHLRTNLHLLFTFISDTSSLHWQNHRQSGADITISCLPMDDRWVTTWCFPFGRLAKKSLILKGPTDLDQCNQFKPFSVHRNLST